MRALQLTVLITTAVVLFGAAGWAMWHTWSQQELPAAPPFESVPGEQPPVLRVHLMDRPVRGHDPAFLAPWLRRGVWHQYLWRKENTAGRAHALAGLRSRIQAQLEAFGVHPSGVRAEIRKDAQVEDDAVALVVAMFGELGVEDVVVQPPP